MNHSGSSFDSFYEFVCEAIPAPEFSSLKPKAIGKNAGFDVLAEFVCKAIPFGPESELGDAGPMKPEA